MQFSVNPMLKGHSSDVKIKNEKLTKYMYWITF